MAGARSPDERCSSVSWCGVMSRQWRHSRPAVMMLMALCGWSGLVWAYCSSCLLWPAAINSCPHSAPRAIPVIRTPVPVLFIAALLVSARGPNQKYISGGGSPTRPLPVPPPSLFPYPHPGSGPSAKVLRSAVPPPPQQGRTTFAASWHLWLFWNFLSCIFIFV